MLHPSIHPSIPHRAPAQVLSAGPTNPRQPWVTAHAGDTGHPHHITGADAVSSWNSCPGRCYCISHSESFKAKSPSLGRTKCHVCSAEQWPRAEHVPPGVVPGQHSCHTHNISSDPQSCTNKRLPSTASQYTLGVLIPSPSLFQILEQLTSTKGESCFTLAACHSSGQRRQKFILLLLPNFESQLR